MEEFTTDSPDDLFVSPLSSGEVAPEPGSIAATPTPVDGQHVNTLDDPDSPSAVFESIEGSHSLDVPSVDQTVDDFGHDVGVTIQKVPFDPSPASETPHALPFNFEIVLPPLTREVRNQYQDVESDVVDFVIEQVHDQFSQESLFRLEFTDGRQDLVSPDAVVSILPSRVLEYEPALHVLIGEVMLVVSACCPIRLPQNWSYLLDHRTVYPCASSLTLGPRSALRAWPI